MSAGRKKGAILNRIKTLKIFLNQKVEGGHI